MCCKSKKLTHAGTYMCKGAHVHAPQLIHKHAHKSNNWMGKVARVVMRVCTCRWTRRWRRWCSARQRTWAVRRRRQPWTAQTLRQRASVYAHRCSARWKKRGVGVCACAPARVRIFFICVLHTAFACLDLCVGVRVVFEGEHPYVHFGGRGEEL